MIQLLNQDSHQVINVCIGILENPLDHLLDGEAGGIIKKNILCRLHGAHQERIHIVIHIFHEDLASTANQTDDEDGTFNKQPIGIAQSFLQHE